MLNISDIIELKIIDINYLGQGVGKLLNYVVFVNGAITGDKVRAKVTDVKKSYALADMVEIIEASLYRVKPECKYYEACGGCQILTLSYDEQLKYKKNNIISNLIKSNVDLDQVQVYDTLGMDNPYRYRNKTAFSIGSIDGEIQIGTYVQSTHSLVNIEACLLHNEIADKILKSSGEIFAKLNIKPYNRKTHTGTLRHLVIRTNKDNQAMVIIVTNSEILPNSKKLVDELVGQIPEIKTIVQNINNKSGSVILGSKNITLFGDGKIVDYIDNLQFIISPHTFFQVNSIQTERLYEKVIEYADLSNHSICFDLYCGIGTISLMAARKARKVLGVEIVEQSIEDAKKNAKANKIANIEFITGKVEEVLPRQCEKGVKADVIIIDPPRKGCEKEVLEAINNINPKRVVYVSCNPATLGRDLKILQNYGFKLEKLQPVDMFCQSTHIETCVLLSKL